MLILPEVEVELGRILGHPVRKWTVQLSSAWTDRTAAVWLRLGLGTQAFSPKRLKLAVLTRRVNQN